MLVYLEALGSIVQIYVAILNLSNHRFKLAEIVGVMAVSEAAAAIAVSNGSEFAAILSIILISMVFLYWRTRRLISVSLPFISVILSIFTDFMITNVAVSLLHINMQAIKNDHILYWEAYIFNFLIVYVLSKVIGALINKRGKVSILEIRGAFGILLIFSLFLTLVIFYFNTYFYIDAGYTKESIKINGALFFIYSLLLMVIIYTIIKGIKKDTEARNKQIQLEQMQEYSRNLEKMYTEMRGFRHDYINILSSMTGYLDNKDLDGLEKFFKTNLLPLSNGMQNNNFRLDLLKNIKITELKGLLASKLITAQEKGVEIFIDIVEPVDRIHMDIVELIRVVGILVDNAIEAAQDCDKPSVKLAFVHKDNTLLIVIINSCCANIPPVYKLFEKGFSTKGTDRGLGLYNVRQIIGKYKNVSLDTSVDKETFTQCLEIRNA